MAPFRILFSNLGYARQINGSLRQHMRGLHRHVVCSHKVQRQSLDLLRLLLHQCQADVACLAEIDAGSSNNLSFDQMEFLKDKTYRYAHASNKYGAGLGLDKAALSRGKSNGWLAKKPIRYESRYLSAGTKRLVYFLHPEECPPILFGHFSLRAATRRAQFQEVSRWIDEMAKPVMLLGDFNNFRGESELTPLTNNGQLAMVGGAGVPTFKFSYLRATVDLCLASPSLLRGLKVRVLPQPFSDHEALLIEWNTD